MVWVGGASNTQIQSLTCIFTECKYQIAELYECRKYCQVAFFKVFIHVEKSLLV